jgi:hypothetical protein
LNSAVMGSTFRPHHASVRQRVNLTTTQTGGNFLVNRRGWLAGRCRGVFLNQPLTVS